jgi:large subunit ribosomal protein LP0
MTERQYPVRKQNLYKKVLGVAGQYKSCLLAIADFVGSHQMQTIRKDLRGKAIVTMGKKTMIREVLRGVAENKKELEALIPLIRGNVALIWTNDDPKTVRDIVLANKVPAAAKTGQIATVDVKIPAGPTTLDPGQTSFFQALNIGTKIARGAIEIVNEVQLLKIGDKCGNSEVALLAKLGIKPFSYGLKVETVFDEGSVYPSSKLDVTDAKLLEVFGAAVANVAALSLRIGYPTMASLPHMINNAFRNLLALTMVSEVTFEEAKKFKEAAAAGPAVVATSTATTTTATKESAPKEEEKPKEEEDVLEGGMSLFD